MAPAANAGKGTVLLVSTTVTYYLDGPLWSSYSRDLLMAKTLLLYQFQRCEETACCCVWLCALALFEKWLCRPPWAIHAKAAVLPKTKPCTRSCKFSLQVGKGTQNNASLAGVSGELLWEAFKTQASPAAEVHCRIACVVPQKIMAAHISNLTVKYQGSRIIYTADPAQLSYSPQHKNC